MIVQKHYFQFSVEIKVLGYSKLNKGVFTKYLYRLSHLNNNLTCHSARSPSDIYSLKALAPMLPLSLKCKNPALGKARNKKCIK